MYRKKTILQVSSMGRAFALDKLRKPACQEQGFTHHPPLDGQSRGGPPGRPLVVSRRALLYPLTSRGGCCNRNSGGCVFFRPQSLGVPLRTLSCVPEENDPQVSSIRREPLLLTSSETRLSRARATHHPPLDGQSRGGPRETTRGLPEALLYPLTSEEGVQPKLWRMRFLPSTRV